MANQGIACRYRPSRRRHTFASAELDGWKEPLMALYMDVHHLGEGVSMDDVAKAHQADLDTQGKHGVQYLRYWVDEDHGKVFCLVDAPSAEAAATVHREAHGLVADDVFPVQEGS
jgi:hypothetical protein